MPTRATLTKSSEFPLPQVATNAIPWEDDGDGNATCRYFTGRTHQSSTAATYVAGVQLADGTLDETLIVASDGRSAIELRSADTARALAVDLFMAAVELAQLEAIAECTMCDGVGRRGGDKNGDPISCDHLPPGTIDLDPPPHIAAKRLSRALRALR